MNPTERSIKTEEIQIERKIFLFDLRENDRGQFLRITELAGHNKDLIMIPAPGLEDFHRALRSMVDANKALS